MISIVSMIRRGSVIVSFLFGAAIFHDVLFVGSVFHKLRIMGMVMGRRHFFFMIVVMMVVMVGSIKLNVVDGPVSWQAPSTDSLGTSGDGRKWINLAL